MSTVVVNGVKIETPDGASISVVNGKVFIGGKQIETAKNEKIEIDVTGALVNLSVDIGDVKCQNVEGDINAGGSVNADSVGGSVDAGGSVSCDNVGGNVDAGGSVNCGKIAGSVKAGGSVNCG